MTVGSRERNSLGQELLDDISQHLVGTALAAKVLAKRLAEQNNPHAAEAQSIVEWLEKCAHKTRQLAHGLLLAAIQPGELGDKLADLAEEGKPFRYSVSLQPIGRYADFGSRHRG